MSYQVLARKWRPKNFTTLAGQEHVVRALTNALDQQRLHHAYLFTGTRGVGKTTLARIFAKSLNCEQGISSQPCGQCTTCQEIDTGRFVDLIEVDAASRTRVEDTRELLDNVQYAPSKGRYKVYLIDEVHMLSGHSFNALLKTLEEPPPHVKFLLATTDPQKLPVTVLSRCLQFHLKNISDEGIFNYLMSVLNAENISYENPAVQLIARAANGSMRDALSLLDQAIAYGNSQLKTAEISDMLGTIERTYIFELLDALTTNNAHNILTTINQLAEQAVDFPQALEELLSVIHQIALVQVVPEALADDWQDTKKIQALAKQFTAEEIQLYYQIGLTGRRDLPFAPSPKSGFEMVLLRMLAFRPANISLPTLEPQPATTISSSNIASAIKPMAAVNEKDSWENLLPKLNLTGASLALAKQCVLEKFTDSEIILTLDSNQAALLNDTQKQRIATAFIEYFQRPLKVAITIGKTTTNTPAAIAKQQQQQRQTTATQAIAQDRKVQALIETFNGTIVPNSIKAIDQ